MTTSLSALFGNDTVKALLSHQLAEGRLAHAYLIEGEAGSGKSLLARLIAKTLCCKGDPRPCGDCAFCRKIEKGMTPDVITIAPPPDRKQITVDQIRHLRSEAYLTPTELPVKLFLMEAADEMNVAAQNALLKVLEEPPASVCFLLMTARPGAILPTVRSRTQALKTELLSDRLLSDCLCASSPEAERMLRRDPDGFSALIKRSGGNVGTALRLLGGRQRAFDPDALALRYLSLLIEGTHGDFSLFAAAPCKDREQFSALLASLLRALRDLTVLKKAAGQSLLFFSDPEAARALSASLTARALLSLYDTVLEAANENVGNLNLATAQMLLSEQLRLAKSL